MESLLQDLRFGLRGLRNRPALTLIAVLSLGLGIGANTTVFSWLDGMVLDPLPAVPQFDRLVAVNTRGPGGAEWSVSYPSLRDWRAGSQTIDVAGAGFVQVGLRGDDGATERTWGLLVSGNYFDVLRVRPALGRLLTVRDEDDRTPVVVLGYSFWQRRFGGDSGIVGRHVSLNAHEFVVVGIAPPRFGGTIIGLQFDLYTPVTMQPVLTASNSLDRRQSQWLNGVGRIRDGVTFAQASQELDALAQRIGTESGDTDAAHGAIISPMNAQGAASFLRPVFLALLGITAVVLLIACANVANLLLARALSRRREIGIRLAIGADRRRLVRQLLTESFTLAALAGGLGLLCAAWGRDLLMAFIPPSPFPIGIDLSVNPRVVLFALGVTFATALLFGLVPALQASRPELVPALKDEIGSGPAHRSRLQPALVVGQVALALVSLACAGLFARSLAAARQADVGFADPQHALLVDTDLQLAGVTDSSRTGVIRRLVETLRAQPGVTYASVATQVPLGFGGSSARSVTVEGYTPVPDENMSIEYTMAGPDYFPAMGIPLTAGRGIEARDADGAPDVVVVNEQFVRRFLPDVDPVGHRLQTGSRWWTIVGVAKQGRYQTLTESPLAMIYYPILQEPRSGFTVHVRSTGDPKALVPGLRRAFTAVNSDLPFLDVRTMEEHMGAALFVQKIGATMLAGFGALALLLSAIGLYGVMAHSVSLRTREIGVRVALGAARGDVLGLVVGRAMRLAGIGLVIGLAGAYAVGRLLQSQLVGVSGSDPVTFGLIALLLGAVALLASWLPARRAARVDPMAALRAE